MDERKRITLEDLKGHNKPGDLWISIQGKVYDVSAWAEIHPGGAGPLLTMAGQEVTDAFIAYHPGSAWQHLDRSFNSPVTFREFALDLVTLPISRRCASNEIWVYM